MKNGVITDTDGTRRWYVDGKLHRIDGPAVECLNGYKVWWVDDKIHREDGPAIEHEFRGRKSWFIDGVELTESQFNSTTYRELTKLLK